MTRCHSLAIRLREVFLDGKWIANTNVRQEISSISWHEAIQSISNMNSIAALTYHLNYYLEGLQTAYETGILGMNDKFSFDLPEIESEQDWEILKNKCLLNAELFSKRIESMDDSILDENFIDKKFGTHLRNIEGVIEHSYYHLGQMVLIKKFIAEIKS
jgi:hypothetical protein